MYRRRGGAADCRIQWSTQARHWAHNPNPYPNPNPNLNPHPNPNPNSTPNPHPHPNPNPNQDGCVYLILRTNNETRIKAAATFAERLFEGESFVVHSTNPKPAPNPNPNLNPGPNPDPNP